MRRVPSVLLVLAFALLGMPLGASAHDVIESTDPQDGSTVAQLPQQVSLAVL